VIENKNFQEKVADRHTPVISDSIKRKHREKYAYSATLSIACRSLTSLCNLLDLIEGLLPEGGKQVWLWLQDLSNNHMTDNTS